MVGKRRLVSAVAALLLSLPGAACARPGLIVGVADDYLKTEPGRAASAIHALGFSAVRLTLDWSPGQSALDASGHAALQAALGAGTGLRVVVAVYSRTSVPLTEPDRQAYCSYLRSIVTTFPQINDVVVWNEVNKSTFWRPQFASDGSSAAPRDYARLLAHCYETLHAARPGVNVIHAGLSSTGNDRPNASSNVSHSPGNFLRQEGEVLRTELAGKRLFDTLGLHPYGENSAEPPWKRHDASSTIAIGDWGRLMQALNDAFAGTAQPLPGEGSRVWYLETGFQTVPGASVSSLYSGIETDPHALPAGPAAARALAAEPVATHGSQLVDAIRRAYCQPYVDAYFNFLVRDEQDLGRWQSGMLWADWTPEAVGGVAAGRDRGGARPASRLRLARGRPGRGVPGAGRRRREAHRVAWGEVLQLAARSLAVPDPGRRARDLHGRARPRRAGCEGRTASAAPVLSANGELRKLYFSIVKFPSRRLPAGRYRMEITLTSVASSARSTTLRGPVFIVRPRRS